VVGVNQILGQGEEVNQTQGLDHARQALYH
jgi:hypothetical protein